uniref:Calponin-homology (CH) domain-containing protein n=1 Tax=Parastrongyloides trichosuri TaxID=131310 RepID=A0A0N4ZNK5_PARTI
MAKDIENDVAEKLSEKSFEQVNHNGSNSSTEDLAHEENEYGVKVGVHHEKIIVTEVVIDKNGNTVSETSHTQEEKKDVISDKIQEDEGDETTVKILEVEKVNIVEEKEKELKVCRCSCGKTIIGDGVIVTDPTTELEQVKQKINFVPRDWISFKERATIQRALQTITSWVIKTIHSTTLKKKYEWILKSSYLTEKHFVEMFSDGDLFKRLAASLSPKYKFNVINVNQVVIDCINFVDYNRLKFNEYCHDVFGLKKEDLYNLEDFDIKKNPKGYRNIFHTLCLVALKCNKMRIGDEFINYHVFINMKSSILERREIGFDVYTYINNLKHNNIKVSTSVI